MRIYTKRVYEPISKDDGVRVLVDRVWPRGMSKERLKIDLWLNDAAPSTALRKWFAHDPYKWKEFKKRYFSELETKQLEIQQFLELAANGPLVLLYAAKDTNHNQAVALKEYLSSLVKRNKASSGHDS